jgi:hypothetical protein
MVLMVQRLGSQPIEKGFGSKARNVLVALLWASH